MMNLCRNKLSLLMGATAVLGAATVVPASAQTIPLAGFTQTQPGTPFHYTANPGPANATFSASTLVDFTFLNAAAFGAPGGTFLGATLTLTGMAADIATFGVNDSQPVSITGLTITAGPTLLLGMTAADAGVGFFVVQPQITGLEGSTSIGLQGSTTGPAPAAIVYSSDVATIGPGDRDFSLSLTSLTTPLTFNPGDLDFLSFNSSIAGVFGATAGVPEPGSMGMLIGIGVTGTAVMFRRRRRA
jgi:hypothetical protein